jgi:hypothetical protein
MVLTSQTSSSDKTQREILHDSQNLIHGLNTKDLHFWQSPPWNCDIIKYLHDSNKISLFIGDFNMSIKYNRFQNIYDFVLFLILPVF